MFTVHLLKSPHASSILSPYIRLGIRYTNYINPGNCLEIMVESKTFYEEYYYDDDDVVAAVIVTVIHHAL